MHYMFTRSIRLPHPPSESFFLWGPRQCGKTTVLRQSYPDARWIDLLRAEEYRRYLQNPELLREEIAAPKFYFSDVGVVNFLAKRGQLEPGSELFGKAFENWVFHELSAHNSYLEAYADISYWRLASGIEVDFIIDADVAIEAKATHKVTTDHLKGLRQLFLDYPGIKRRMVVNLEPKPRRTDDGIDIMPVGVFVRALADGEIFRRSPNSRS